MKSLIVEDDFTCRKLLQIYLADLGQSYIAVNGREAIMAFTESLDKGEPYDLICMDIMMPEMDGVAALEEIRRIEAERGIRKSEGVKVIMTTAKGKPEDISGAFDAGCEAYIVKPIVKGAILAEIGKLGLTAAHPQGRS